MEKEKKSLVETINDAMLEKTIIICKNYCKYYEECFKERPDDYKEDNIWDECPLLEFY